MSNSKIHMVFNYINSYRVVGRYILLVILLAMPGVFAAQDVKVSATLDTNSILIGEQTVVHVTIQYRADKGNVAIQWPALNDTIIKQIEIVNKTKIDTTIPNKDDPYWLQQSQNLIITSFDSGYYAIPPFKFILNNDTSKVFETEALLLEVNNVQVDTTQAIRDIKPPMDEPFDFRELIPYVKWVVGILALLTLVIYLIKRYLKSRKTTIVVKSDPKVPPHITALAALEQINNEKLWQQGKYKQYHSAISDILRLYLQQRFKINAPEQTSDEIFAQLRSMVMDEESKQRLKQILTLADLVKFAKENPLPNENELSMQLAVDFVNGTKREEEVKSEAIETKD
ncbi:MAG: cell wall anchor protein [Bacteroidetes bacterium]|nr:cell wall anchor protein [Bacteroidota bacterium]